MTAGFGSRTGGTDEIIAVGLGGTSEVVGHGPGGLGWSIDWLPDGTLLTTGARLIRIGPGDSLVAHADLSHLAGDWNEIVVDGRGNAYVNGRLFGPEDRGPSGIVALVASDGPVRQVADGLAFPNGMAVTPDNRTLIVAGSYAECLTAYEIAPTERTRADACGPRRPAISRMASASTPMARSGTRTSATRVASAFARAARC